MGAAHARSHTQWNRGTMLNVNGVDIEYQVRRRARRASRRTYIARLGRVEPVRLGLDAPVARMPSHGRTRP